ncbi:MAG: chemotaxis response regulator protein-glutamate methylesterase [Pseudomonadota bacterium]
MAPAGKIRVLIVDDSVFMRGAIQKILEADPRLSVAGLARDGLECVEQVESLRPDVVTLDLNMPRMDGAAALRLIMRRRPTPVVMLSAYTRDGARETFEALAAGAVDFIAKPSGEVSAADFNVIAPVLVEKVVQAATAVPRELLPIPSPATNRQPKTIPPKSGSTTGSVAIVEEPPQASARVVVIGISAGGPSTLARVLPTLPADIHFSLLIVQHMPAQFTAALSERLDAQSAIRVREAKNRDRPRQGEALIAPGDRHLEFDRGGIIRIYDGPEVNGCRPSVDVAMKSAARIYGSRAVGIIMTGMGKDGSEGLLALRKAGCKTLAQDEGSCVVYGMPRAAVEAGAVDEVFCLDELPARLLRL